MSSVDRATFATFVLSHDPREFPGLRGFGFIRRVMREDLDSFVAAERADGAPQFAIRALSDANYADLFVVKYIEPASNNSRRCWTRRRIGEPSPPRHRTRH